MKNRRNKTSKPGARHKPGATDISPSTSLPPLVEGQLRCFLIVTVSKVLWTVLNPPSSVLVRLRWWGETSNGTIFRPRVNSQTEHKAVKTTTRYAVRCGPKQFSSYLTDMGSMVLDIMTKLGHLPIGRVQINGISRLSPSQPIRGFFTIVSPTSEKLGELQVSVALEPLSETYDSSSSIQNTDISVDTALSVGKCNRKVEVENPLQTRTLSESSRASTPRGKDYLYFQENADPNKLSLKGYHELMRTENPITAAPNMHENRSATQSPSSAPATKDLISVLLDQGNKLRDAMVVSALQSDPIDDPDVDLKLSPELNKDLYSFFRTRGHSDVLKIHNSPSSKGIFLHQGRNTVLDVETPSESKAIELILGSSSLSPGYYWDGTGSPPESISGSDMYNESEFNDPQYDLSLLENLFYTAHKSDSSLSDLVSDDDDPTESLRRKSKRITVKHRGPQLDQAARKENILLENSGLTVPERSLKNSVKSNSVDLTVDRLAQLGRMHVARVVVDTLKIHPDKWAIESKINSKGKPPRPATSIKRTFFVEFHFPVSSKTKGDITLANEITRLVSNKIVSGFVKFQQRFVFPVLFSGRMIEHWWNTDLIFKIFLRNGAQKKPGLVGSANLPLRDVLLSQGLSVSCNLDVHETEPQQETSDVGPLQISVELAGESKELTRAASGNNESTKQTPQSSVNHSVTFAEPEIPAVLASEHSSQTQPISHIPAAKVNAPPHIAAEGPRVPLSQQQAIEESGLLLHVVLMVQEGRGLIPAGNDSLASCNSYLNCKLFSSPEATRSAVVWGTTQPIFNFTQVAPVSLTNQLLERLNNNVMVIEVWNKVSGPGRDQLLGLAKLPLNQFYMSFRDPKISLLLLQAQYPVVAVDSYVPITDVFSGSEKGRIKVLLAMGSGDQVVALQRLKHEDGETPLKKQISRPAHFLDSPQSSVQTSRPQEGLMDHIFEVHVENVRGLTPLQSTVWGEADCFVQYYFPMYSPNSGPGVDLPEGGISLKPVRTSTTLCVPDPVFNDRQSHSLVAPADTPVQRLLLNAYSKQGLSGGGGVTFEIWCRYYYPNVRDQMVATGVLPLSRLCAMVTMQHREDVGIQAFSLPLTPRSQSPGDKHSQSSGLLNVNVTYRRSVRNAIGMLATKMASISVQIHRASGLQAAARAVAMRDVSFQYNADVGVNAFVTIQPSFLPDAERRITRTVARTFSPEFDHHSEFPCNLVIQRSNGEASSLAEVLSFSDIVFSVHHQSVMSDTSSRTQPARDYHLGVVRIPAKELLTRRSGVSGWYPITIEEDAKLADAPSILQTIVGGLELSIGFSHHSDRERVLEVARGLGWTESEKDTHEVSVCGEDEWQQKEDLITLSVTIPKIWLPVHCLLLAGQNHIHRSTYCYLRYKFYDREAFCSTLVRPKLSEDGQQATVMFEQTKSMELMKHQPLVWYLREERLEIQVWRSYGKDTSGPRPQDSDRLLGCAYVALGTLSENTSRTLTISGVYPLFKRNVSNLWGAAVRVHLALSSAYHPSVAARRLSYTEEMSPSEEEDSIDHSEEKPDLSMKSHQILTSPNVPLKSPDSHSLGEDLENTFAVNIVIERAMHLSLKGTPLTEREVSTPSCCVSFPVAGSATPVSTPVIENTDSPIWSFQNQTRLPNELLLDPQQSLVFKVWHKTDVERVLGFASVDLSPLLSGFQSVCGWYNIGDFTGQCQGQIKVSITPLESIAQLKEERRAKKETTTARTQVPSHGSFIYPNLVCDAFSSYTASHTEDLVNPSVNLISGSHAHPRYEVSSPLRHEEHMNNVRRFHESLQQAERNTHCAAHLDLLSQSSRTSLLATLRKNLSELDDIQKYFNQKLYRSLSSQNTQESSSCQSERVQETHPSLAQNQDESDTKLLLRKSSLLVSQVSSFITDLQQLPKSARSTSSILEESPNIQHLDTKGPEYLHSSQNKDGSSLGLGHTQLFESKSPNIASPPFSPRDTPPPQEDIHDLMKEKCTSEEDQLLEEEPQEYLDERELQYVSDEEFEVDFIEPRTLNEITTMTDRTSPWSSILSDTDPDEDPIKTAGRGQPIGIWSSDSYRNETDIRSSFYPVEEISSPSAGCDESEFDQKHSIVKDASPSNINQESTAPDDIQLLSTGVQRVEEELERNVDNNVEECIKPLPVLCTDRTDSTSGSSSDPEKTEPVGLSSTSRSDSSITPEPGDSESDTLCVPSLSLHTGPSDEGATELSNLPSSSNAKSSDLLSDPVLVPNFFLPPQHLEASMRFLSQLPARQSSAALKDETNSPITKGIPFRRHPRQKPKFTAADLPKEETSRIARIFAAKFSKPKDPSV
ncbi:C2 domain-containing protein 3 [Pelobates fuscus]|uniref:C2 domain-containing protein 3 n=1 Tax=Pelobates fuscus TaxID=191477 RepID=UPI002FE462CC